MRTRPWARGIRLAPPLVFLAAGLAWAGEAPDEARSAWRWRRAVTVTQGGTFAALELPPELQARCQPDLRDVRLVAPEGQEAAYVVDRLVVRESAPQWSGRLADTQIERKVATTWDVDLDDARTFDRILLEVPGSDFAKRLRIETSDDGAQWRLLDPDAGVFEREWAGERIRHTTLELSAPVTARRLRLTADDRRTPPIDITGVVVSEVRRVGEARWQRNAPLAPARAERGRSRYRLGLPPGLPVEELVLDAADPAFSRRTRLIESIAREGRTEERTLGDATLYRLRLDDAALTGEALTLAVQHPRGGELLLEIEDRDSPALRGLRVRVGGAVARLIFVRPDGPLTLYYGNDATRAPLYDIQSLRWSLGLNPAFAPSALGPEAENPRFAPLPPLAFAPSAGAPLEVVRWRNERRFSVGPREDIYSLTLAPEDLARLRPDLGDLRVADAEDRQVPYVLEPSAQDARVHLRHEKDATPARRGERTRALTRCRLWIADSSAGLLRLPLRSLELAFTETFFSRPARVLAPSERGARREHEVELYSGTLARGAAQGAAPAAEPPPISLPLDGAARAELFLEIDEGDNAPLTITAAAAVVRVPRLSFKARPGEYRLLLGNAEAAAPRYDIAALAREVLAYSAVVVEAAARTENPAFRRRAGDYFQNAPPTVLLWGTLIVAVVGLVFLTARLLRSPQG